MARQRTLSRPRSERGLAQEDREIRRINAAYSKAEKQYAKNLAQYGKFLALKQAITDSAIDCVPIAPDQSILLCGYLDEIEAKLGYSR